MFPSSAEGRVPLITLPNWVKAAAACGFSIGEVFEELGFEPDLLHVERATVPASDMERLMSTCVARSKRRHFPFALGDTFAFEYLPELETFLTTSATLRESARSFEWMRVLISPLLRLEVHESLDIASLRLDPPHPARSPPVFQWFVEATFASVVKMGRALLQGRGDFRCATFRCERPPYAEEARQRLHMPVTYGQPHNALEMDRRLLDLRLQGAFDALHRQAEHLVARRLAERPAPPGIATQLEHAMERRPALLGQDIGQIARELGLHPRTLQRRLARERVRFAELRANTRLNLARHLLADRSLDIETISERLGFADRRSFTRAFARWTGKSPSAFRLGKD